MKKLLVSMLLLLSFSMQSSSAATNSCTITIPDGEITFTQTRVRVTYPNPLSCSNLPAGAVITNVYEYFLFTNILSLGDIEVRLAAGNQQFELPVSITGTAPTTPEIRGGSAHSSTFNDMSAETAFTLSAIFVDPSTNPNGYGLEATPIKDFQLIISYQYDDSPPPIADFSFSSTDLTATFQNLSIDGQGTLSYVWNFGDGSSSSVASPSHTYTIAGTYSVTLIATDELGRYHEEIQSITVLDTEYVSLDISSVTYEYSNCTFYNRNGFISWISPGLGAGFEVEEKVGNVYYNIYTGTGTVTGLSYSKTANQTATYQLRIRASLNADIGNWKNFSATVPFCGLGGPPPL